VTTVIPCACRAHRGGVRCARTRPRLSAAARTAAYGRSQVTHRLLGGSGHVPKHLGRHAPSSGLRRLDAQGFQPKLQVALGEHPLDRVRAQGADDLHRASQRRAQQVGESGPLGGRGGVRAFVSVGYGPSLVDVRRSTVAPSSRATPRLKRAAPAALDRRVLQWVTAGTGGAGREHRCPSALAISPSSRDDPRHNEKVGHHEGRRLTR
jgi:hypothetical protein